MAENFNEMAARQLAEAKARAAAVRLTMTPEQEVETDKLLACVEQALQNWRDRYGAPAPVQTNFHTCEYESSFQDFDGTWATMICGQPATQQLIVNADFETKRLMVVEVCDWHAAVTRKDLEIEAAEREQAWLEYDADHPD